MITLINENLFELVTNEETTENGNFFKTDVLTSMKVKKAKDNSMGKTRITSIKSSNKDFNACYTNVVNFTNKIGKTIVTLKAMETNRYDNDVYLIAIPFNGIAEPIANSPQYRIHHGLIVHSDKKNIKFNDETYTKVLYLMVEPNKGLFKEDHKYHVDEIHLTFSSYNLETIDDNTTTKKYTVDITFTEDSFRDYVKTSEETEPVNPEDFKGKRLLPLYRKNNMKHKTSGDTEHNNNKKSSSESNENFEKMIDTFNRDSKDTAKYLNRKNRKGNRR